MRTRRPYESMSTVASMVASTLTAATRVEPKAQEFGKCLGMVDGVVRVISDYGEGCD